MTIPTVTVNVNVINSMALVREFMQKFEQDCPTEPVIPPHRVRKLRDYLYDEEEGELGDAKDPVEALDAVTDLLYVVFGAAIAYGFNEEHTSAAFLEVHRSNMTKLWTTAEAMDHLNRGNKPVYYVKRVCDGERCMLVRTQSGKVIKSPSYSPPNLRPILEANQ